METTSVFATLSKINVNEHTEKKNGLTYLSWAWAWGEVKKAYPTATYTVYEKDGICYFTDGKTAWVKTGVTIEGLEHIEYLPIMDYNNRSIPLEKVTSFDVNKAIQRSLTKACARHGLGLYIYAGEDLPEGDENAPQVGSELASQKQIDLIFNLLKQKNLYLRQFGITTTQGLTKNQASELINRIGAYQPPKPTLSENDDLPF